MSRRNKINQEKNPNKENFVTSVNSRKRRTAVIDENDRVLKKLRTDVNVIDNENLQYEFSQDETYTALGTNQYRKHLPNNLIELMYQLDLAILCSLRKLMYEHKYPSLSLVFEDSEIDAFNHIILRYQKKSIYIRIENVDNYYILPDISYAKLFTGRRASFSINSYFNSFAKHIILKEDNFVHNVEYLIVYTNSGLNLTKENELKKDRCIHFYPFKFDNVNIEECDILRDFLFTNDNTQLHGFYQFSQEKTTREEVIKRLEFSSAMQKIIKGRKLSQEFEKEIKKAYLDKIVFAINQPSRKKLNNIIKNEIEISKILDDYTALQERILCDFKAPEKCKKFGTIYPTLFIKLIY